MVKSFANYQYVPIEPMSERDEQEKGSKFWNEGKWETFIKPFIRESKGMVLVDMGSNAGLFLKLAEDMGFNAVGVESNVEAFNKAVDYREQNGGNYKMYCTRMEESLNILPVSDYTIIANTHYYLAIDDWLNYLDKLIAKTRYVILVTCEKDGYKDRIWKGSCFVPNIRHDFKLWEEVGVIDNVLEEGPHSRKLRTLCFKSPYIERVDINKIDASLDTDGFYRDIDAGVNPHETSHAKNLLENSQRKYWGKRRFNRFLQNKVDMFYDIKENGIREPVIINSENKICEGNNRFKIMSYLGYNSILVRRVLC